MLLSMDTAILRPQSISYWNVIKDASEDVKFDLVEMLLSSLRKMTKSLSPAEIRAQKEKEFWASFNDESEDHSVDVSWIHEIVKDMPKIDADVDYDRIKYDYLMEKYG